MTAVETRRYTPDDLLRMEDGSHYELVDGQLVERNSSTDSSEVAACIGYQLVAFRKANDVGRAYDATLGVRAFPDDPDRVLRADVSWVHESRAPDKPTAYLRVIPDLVVEVVSLRDKAVDVRSKVDAWLDAGVRIVWVASPRGREVTVYRAGRRPVVLTTDDEIDGEEVIPGFRCPVASFFPAPLPVMLAQAVDEDPA
jgi:Uma2 family endonuclease